MSKQSLYGGAPLIWTPLGPSTGGWIVKVYDMKAGSQHIVRPCLMLYQLHVAA